MNKKATKKFVSIGGGTGTGILLRGLREYPIKLSAIVTTADTGGSSGRLRYEVGMVPPGDARQCLVALNDGAHPIFEHFNSRFSAGHLEGHAFGNIFLTLLWQKYGDFQKAIEETERIFNSDHSVIPVTKGPTNLIAHLKDGSTVIGEHDIIGVNGLNEKISKLSIVPNVGLNPKAKKAIETADIITIGPGNIFGSLTPPLLVRGMKKAILKSEAKKILVLNLMNQKGLTEEFGLADYLGHFKALFKKDIFTNIIYNNRSLEKHIKKLNTEDDEIKIQKNEDPRLIGAYLFDETKKIQNPHDPIYRTAIRHDSNKLAKVIYKLTND